MSQARQPCPGCRAWAGPAGALCPYCGSRLPVPGRPEAAAPAVAVAAGLGLLALVVALFDSDTAGAIGGLAILVFIGAAAVAIGNSGRVGPARQTSCCGCSCALSLVPLLVLAYVIGVIAY